MEFSWFGLRVCCSLFISPSLVLWPSSEHKHWVHVDISAKTPSQWRNGTVKSQVLISCEFYKFCSVKISKGVWVEHRVGGISTISHFNAADSDSKMAGKSIKLKWSINKTQYLRLRLYDSDCFLTALLLSECSLIALWPRKMKIDCSRQTCPAQTDRQTDTQSDSLSSCWSQKMKA